MNSDTLPDTLASSPAAGIEPASKLHAPEDDGPRNKPTPEARALTPPAVAKKYAVNVHRVLAWIAKGDLAAVNVGDGSRPRWRIMPEALAEFERRRRRNRRPRRHVDAGKKKRVTPVISEELSTPVGPAGAEGGATEEGKQPQGLLSFLTEGCGDRYRSAQWDIRSRHRLFQLHSNRRWETRFSSTGFYPSCSAITPKRVSEPLHAEHNG